MLVGYRTTGCTFSVVGSSQRLGETPEIVRRKLGRTMDEIRLELPSLRHKRLANDFKKEFFDNGEMIINGSALFDQMDFEAWLAHNQSNRCASTVRNDWVVATTFFAVRRIDEKIIGMIDIRHHLEHPFLAQYGGHIGYAVRPSERQKGYATKMLQLALVYAKTLDLEKMMLGCYSDNLASIKTITKCGGVLKESKPYVDGKCINVYWINIP
jgi:predicted acetyltransferase